MNLASFASWCAVLAACACSALAGPLNPPPGPVTDTGVAGGVTPPLKTLGQVEPRTAVQSLAGTFTALYVISQPGSYYLTGNVQGIAGMHGISITAENVTLDLSGFAIIGVSGAGDGITTANYVRNVTVMNGTVRNWPGTGVNVQADNGRMDGLRVSNCTLAGINTGSSLGTTISNCSLTDNAAGNIFTGGGCIVSSCTIINTALTGTAIGINTADGTIVRDCNLQGLRGAAIQTGGSCTIQNNTIATTQLTGTGVGISSGDATIIRDCNLQGVRGVGIQTGGSCTILNNTIINGKADAVNVGQRTLVKGNNISGHTGSGIVLNGASCTVQDNMLVSNAPGSTTAGGIITTQNHHHITGNTMMQNGLGLKATGLGCFIARNTGRANAANFTIGGSNAVGPLVSIALQGDIGDIPAANHPWANFTY